MYFSNQSIMRACKLCRAEAMLTLTLVSGKWEILGFIFAYPSGIVVTMQVCHFRNLRLVPDEVKPSQIDKL